MSRLHTYSSLIKELRKVIGYDECTFVIRINSYDKRCFYDVISMFTCGINQKCRSISIEHIHPSCENGEEKRTCNGKKNEPSADNSIHVLRSGGKIHDNVTVHDLNVTHTADSSETNNEKVEHRPTTSLKAETPKLNNRFQSKKENVTRSNHSSRVDITSVPVYATTHNRLREASEELHSTAVTNTQNYENDDYKLHKNSHSEMHSQPSCVVGDNIGTSRQIHMSNKSSCASSSVPEKLMCKGNNLGNSSCDQQTLDHVDSNEIIATTVLKESEVTDDITDIGSSTTKPEEETLLKFNNSSMGKLPHLEENLQPIVLLSKTLVTKWEQLEKIDVAKSMNNVTSGKSQTVTESGSNNNIYEGHVNNSSHSKRSRIRHCNENRQSPYASRRARGSVSKLNLSKVSIRDDLENVCNDQPAVPVTNGHIPPAKIKASYEVKDSCEGTLPRMDKSFQPVAGTSEGAHIPRNINLETSRKANDFVSVSHTVSHNVVDTSYRSSRNKNRNNSTLNTTSLVEESQIMEGNPSQTDVEMSLNSNEDSSVANSFKLPQNIGCATARKVRRTSTTPNTSILNEPVYSSSIQECGSVGRIKIFTLKQEDSSISSLKRPMFAFPYSPRRKIPKQQSNSENSNMLCFTDVDTSVQNNLSEINTTFTSSKKDPVKNNHTYIKNVNESTKNLESVISKEKGETSFPNCKTNQTEYGKKSDKDPKAQSDASLRCKSVGSFKNFTSIEDQNSSISSKNRPMFAVPFPPRNNRPNSNSKIGSERCFTDIETSKENNVSKINSTFSRVSIPHTSSSNSPVKNHQAHIKNVTESSKNLDCKNIKDKKVTFYKNCQNIGCATARKVRRTSTTPNTSILNESVYSSSIQECGSVGRIKIFTLKQEDSSISSLKRPMFAFPYSPRRKIPKQQSNSENSNMLCFTDVDTSVQNNLSEINTTFTSSKKDPVKNNHTYIKNVNESTKNLESVISKEKGETSFPNCKTNQTEYGKKSDKDPKAQSDASLRCKSVGSFKNFTSIEDQNSSISSKNRPMFAVPFPPRNNRPNSNSKIGSERCFTDIETSKENNVSKINSTFSRVSIPHTSSSNSPVKNHQAHIKNVTESSKNLDCKNIKDKKVTFYKNCQKNHTENRKQYDEDTRVPRHSSKTSYSNNDADDDNNSNNASSPTLDARKKSDSGFSYLRFIKKCSKKPQKDKDAIAQVVQSFNSRVPKVILTDVLKDKTELENYYKEIETEVNARSEDKPSSEKSKTDFVSNDGEGEFVSDASKEVSVSSPSEVNEDRCNLCKRKKKSSNVVQKGKFINPSTGIKYRYKFKTRNFEKGFSAYSEISDVDSSFASE